MVLPNCVPVNSWATSGHSRAAIYCGSGLPPKWSQGKIDDMRVSEYFHLTTDQAELDFVDIDVRDDKRLFVDPHALRLARTPWSQRAAHLVSSYFSCLLDHIRAGHREEAYALLCHLLEPNETHLGYSVAKSRGHALGQTSALLVLDALTTSHAVSTGVLRDLEDTVLLIAGIDKDIVSDMTTNIIRSLLIEYTQMMCQTYEIPTRSAAAGPMWDTATLRWQTGATVALPHGPNGPLLFVPKIAVRVTPELERGEYHRGFVAPALQGEELAAGSELVRLAKSGNPKVLKKDVNRKHGAGKDTTIGVTQRHPELLDAYRKGRSDRMKRVPSQHQLASAVGAPQPKYPQIVARTLALPSGDAAQSGYAHRAFRCLGALLYPNVTSPADVWQLDGFAGVHFSAVAAADGPLSPVLNSHLVTGVQVVAWNGALDHILAARLVAVSRRRHQANELLVVVARAFTADARELIVQQFAHSPVIVLNDTALTDAAHALQSSDVERVADIFTVAA